MKKYNLIIDEQKQTIQGIYIQNQTLFQQIRFVVQNNHLEGWNPETSDIELLIEQAQHPDFDLVKEINEVF